MDLKGENCPFTTQDLAVLKKSFNVVSRFAF
jgi:hypothetical protein